MNAIESVLKTLLKEKGFSKKGKTWSIKNNEVILEIKLTKDIFRKEQSYLEWRFTIIELSTLQSLNGVWLAHGRSYSMAVQDKVELEQCLNENYSLVSGIPRLEHLKRICEKKYVPFVLSLQNVRGIKQVYEEGQLRASAVRTELVKFLKMLPA